MAVVPSRSFVPAAAGRVQELHPLREGDLAPEVTPRDDSGAAQDAAGGTPGRPAHRRRKGWFELNPGCLTRALAIGALALAPFGFLGGWLLWRALHALRRSRALRLAVGTWRAGRHTWRAYRRVRHALGRHR